MLQSVEAVQYEQDCTLTALQAPQWYWAVAAMSA